MKVLFVILYFVIGFVVASVTPYIIHEEYENPIFASVVMVAWPFLAFGGAAYGVGFVIENTPHWIGILFQKKR